MPAHAPAAPETTHTSLNSTTTPENTTKEGTPMITTLSRTRDSEIFWADPRREPVDVLTSVLDQREMERAMTYRRDADRRRFLTAAWLLRTKVGERLGMAPEDVEVERSCGDCTRYHGKPYIMNIRTPLHVSISHSADRVAVAVTESGPIGVDVERIPDVPLEELIRLGLSPAEKEIVLSLPEHMRHAAFTHYWSSKEAVLKATGHGLRIPPAQVLISHPFQEPPALLAWPLEIPVRNVHLRTLDPGLGYVGVVAVIADRPTTVTEVDVTEMTRVPSFDLANAA
ncbi:4'-phosphopantetheinyl transferase superfamily protein [Sphaerisporangium sp. TRM90804]|uniref:4'-phosphopantetheinyl transferase family protein n=1 Tax=Sphaerisporangium sp. TRM90804 TaxID=3031113 RepID=UPI0024476C59|nr:4'-phosphopantetheinyl transferase superfamily protein [Sphaerisporangium sp. TRM90804]MDH2426856.1 4'-phosphopantetheinyl transferase superfamily protein [Sphaerisporangium sp. TRM90804]